MVVESGGKASDITVTTNGSLFVNNGEVSAVTVGGNFDWADNESNDVYKGGVVTVSAAEVNGIKVKTHGTLNVSSGSTVYNAVVDGPGEDSNLGSFAGKMTVSGSTLYDTVVSAGGSVSVESIFLAGGSVIKSLAVGSVIKDGGTMTVNSGSEAKNTTVKTGGVLKIDGTHYGSLNIESGAVVSADGEINFSVVGRTTSDDYLCNAMSLIDGLPRYSVTVDAEQAHGVYRLGKRASAFSERFTLKRSEQGIETVIGTVACGNSFYDGECEVYYSIVKDNKNQLNLKISTADFDPPEKPEASASSRVTNKSVKVTAEFKPGSKIRQYSYGKGIWKTYKSPVVMKNNGMVYFRAADAAGNWSQVESYRVNNIDRTAPVISKVTAAHNGSYGAVNVTFKPDNSGISHCVITCGKKKITVATISNLTGVAKLTGLAIGKHTVSVVAYDIAGNKSKTKKITFTVKDTVAPAKVSTLKAPVVTSKYKGSFSWSAAKDNSGKIAKYQIQLDNGKIYTSTKNRLSVSKLKIGTHTYRVRAIDKAGNVGAWSVRKSFTVKDMTAPSTVSVKTKISGNNATLTWKKPKDNVGVTKYILKYGSKTVSLSGSVTKFTITGLAKGSYKYSMVAVDAAGNKSKVKSGKFTIKQALAPAKAAEALYAADFGSAPEALFAPQNDILAYSNELKSVANLCDSTPALGESKKDERSLFAVPGK